MGPTDGINRRPISVFKYVLADQFAHVECDVAVVFDSAFAFRFRDKRAFRQRLAGYHSLPPRARLS
jgi:hypothetical protein